MRLPRSILGCLVALAFTSCELPRTQAQSLTVQQPVVDVFNVSTVVSVPDRGSTLLGGISRAAEARGRFGFMPGGSSLGLERSNTTASAHVYIHDLAGLDEELLAMPVDRSPDVAPNPNRLAAQAYRSLRQPGLASGYRHTPTEFPPSSQPAPATPGERFAQSLAKSKPTIPQPPTTAPIASVSAAAAAWRPRSPVQVVEPSDPAHASPLAD